MEEQNNIINNDNNNVEEEIIQINKMDNDDNQSNKEEIPEVKEIVINNTNDNIEKNNKEQEKNNNNQIEIINKIEEIKEIKNDENTNKIIEIIEIKKDNYLDNNNKNNNEKKENIEIQGINKNENRDESKLDIIIKNLLAKDEIIKTLQNEIINLKKENEINQIKQNYEKKFNEMKEQMATKEDIKDMKYFVRKREISYLKDEIDAVSSKLNELEKVYDNKIGFMESNMTRIFEKEEELKKKEENQINQINIINDYCDNNNVIKNDDNKNDKDNIIKIEKKEEKGKKKEKDNNKKESQKNLLAQFDKKIYKNFNKNLNDIFSKKHLKDKTIEKKSLENLLKNAKKLFEEKNCPLEYFSQYFSDLIEKEPKEFHDNLNNKKIEIFKSLEKINSEITKKLNLKEVQKENKEIDVKNFDIEAFRKEFNLSKDDFPDERLKDYYIKFKGDTKKVFEGLVFIKKD